MTTRLSPQHLAEIRKIRPVLDHSYSAGLRWALLIGTAFLLVVGIDEALRFPPEKNAFRLAAFLFYGGISLIVACVWLERSKITAENISVSWVVVNTTYAWDDIVHIEYPSSVAGRHAWAYKQYAKITLSSGKTKRLAMGGPKISRALFEFMSAAKGSDSVAT